VRAGRNSPVTMDTAPLLASLSDAFGVSGFEDEVREIIRAHVSPQGAEVRTDTLGNLIVTRRGRGPRILMLDAHMDEIGLMISHVDEDGFLRFATIGGWDSRILLTHAVTIRTRSNSRVRGVIGALPPHVLKPEERDKPVSLDGMFIDVGASSAKEAAALGIRVGDPAVLAYPCELLPDGRILGKALDDRVGCTVLIKVLEDLAGETPPATVVCNFAVAEEVGLRGARTAAYQINPDFALAIEGTVASDVPGTAPPRQVTSLGKGPALTLADATTIVNPRMVQALEDVADEHHIPYQYKTPVYGGTDAGAIHVSRGGVLTGGVSVPCRYIHSPLSLLRLGDVEQAIRLVAAFTREGPQLLD
jgi:tetrahedral aminopeptidase